MIINQEKIKAPSERLKYIREKLLKLTRNEIYQKHGLSQDTLAAWESGKIQITEKGVERCIKIYGAESLIVSKEWLLTGEGLNPSFSFDLNRYFKALHSENLGEKIDDAMLLIKEVNFFRSLAKNTITALITNDDMLPLYSRGDHVGGRLRYGKEIDACIGKDCIVKTKDEATYIRRIAKSRSERKYNLVCINPAWNGNPEPVLFDVEIECAAPIIWLRRADDY